MASRKARFGCVGSALGSIFGSLSVIMVKVPHPCMLAFGGELRLHSFGEQLKASFRHRKGHVTTTCG